MENRLVAASGAKNAALLYDPLGRQFQVSSAATGTTQFLYDGDDLVSEFRRLERSSGATSTAPPPTIRCSGTKARPTPTAARSSPTTRARSPPSPAPAATRSRMNSYDGVGDTGRGQYREVRLYRAGVDRRARPRHVFRLRGTGRGSNSAFAPPLRAWQGRFEGKARVG